MRRTNDGTRRALAQARVDCHRRVAWEGWISLKPPFRIFDVSHIPDSASLRRQKLVAMTHPPS